MKLMNYVIALTFAYLHFTCCAMKQEDLPNTPIISWGSFERQGIRPTMEDAYTHTTLNLVPWAPAAYYFGLFDGHGEKNGAQAADYAARSAVDYFKTAYDEDLQKAPDVEAAIKAALRTSYLFLDQDIRIAYPNDGTTALSALILGDELYLAWAGDTRAVVADANGAIKARTIDHKPNLFEEKLRIIAAGEKITMHDTPHGPLSRVGGLAISRTLGDATTKARTKPDAVIAAPEIIKVRVVRGDLILIACDGLWDVMDNEQAIEFVRQYLPISLLEAKQRFGEPGSIPEHEKVIPGGNSEKLQLIARGLAARAFTKRSTDNISVLIIQIN